METVPDPLPFYAHQRGVFHDRCGTGKVIPFPNHIIKICENSNPFSPCLAFLVITVIPRNSHLLQDITITLFH